VGLGQMHDMHLGLTSEATSEAEILSVYKIKSARYTMALPLILVMTLAETSEPLRTQIAEVAETIGIIFQLKDDELGLFGTETQIGKSVVSDVREGKKTLYYLWGLALATPEQRQQLQSFFGNPDITAQDLETVKDIIISNGARQKVAAKITNLAAIVDSQIAKLPAPEWQAFFKQLLAMNLDRAK